MPIPQLLHPGEKYTLRLIVDDTIAILYIDGVALNACLYAKAGQALVMYVVDGELKLLNPVFQTELRG